LKGLSRGRGRVKQLDPRDAQFALLGQERHHRAHGTFREADLTGDLGWRHLAVALKAVPDLIVDLGPPVVHGRLLLPAGCRGDTPVGTRGSPRQPPKALSRAENSTRLTLARAGGGARRRASAQGPWLVTPARKELTATRKLAVPGTVGTLIEN